jgi:hypothetical protein
MLLIRAYKSPVAKAPAKFLHHPSRECRGLLHSSLITYMGVDQIFYQLLNQLAIVFFFPHTYILEQIQAPRLIVYLSFCEFYPNFDLD